MSFQTSSGKGCFRAALMRNAELVKNLMNSIKEAGCKISIKCRLGIDEFDSYVNLKDFIKKTSESGCKL